MALIEVDVTEADIAMGKRDNCESCPVAIAVARAFDEIIGWASHDIIRANGWIFDTPARVSAFMVDFDGEETVKPFRFALDTDDAFPDEDID